MNQQVHWLYRGKNRLKLWAIMVGLLLLALLPEFFIQHHTTFPESGFNLDTSWGFHAWYGFLTCAFMVVLAKILGIFLKRPDDYYDE